MASSVNLGAALEAMVDQLVRNGRYGSRSEVLREGVRLVEEREKRLARFDAEIRKGLDDCEVGRTHDLDEVCDRLTRKYEAMIAKSKAA